MRAVSTTSTLAAVLTACSFLALPPAALAQSCPADLTSLSGQILSPDLQSALTVRIDDIVARAGNLDQAIANLSQRLDRFSARQANLGTADDEATRRYINEAVVVTSAQLQALRCRKGL